MENKNNLAIVITVIVVALVCYFGYTKNQESKTAVATANSTKELFKEQFMVGCNTEPGLYGYCDCSFDKLYTKLGATGFANLSSEYEKYERLPDGTVEIISSCFNKIK